MFVSSYATYIYKTEEANWSLALKILFCAQCFLFSTCAYCESCFDKVSLKDFTLAGGWFALQLSLMILRHT